MLPWRVCKLLIPMFMRYYYFITGFHLNYRVFLYAADVLGHIYFGVIKDASYSQTSFFFSFDSEPICLRAFCMYACVSYPVRVCMSVWADCTAHTLVCYHARFPQVSHKRGSHVDEQINRYI